MDAKDAKYTQGRKVFRYLWMWLGHIHPICHSRRETSLETCNHLWDEINTFRDCYTQEIIVYFEGRFLLNDSDFLVCDMTQFYTFEDCIILSLQPYAANLMASGTKKWEFRTIFRKRPTLAFIYTSTPVMAITAVIELGLPVKGTAEELKPVAELSAESTERMKEYFKKKGYGYAIPILNWFAIEPIGLTELRDHYNFRPPQSYMGFGKQEQLLRDLLQRHKEVMARELKGKIGFGT